MWHRRKLAAICAAVAVFAVLTVLEPPPPPRVVQVIARHDIAAGAKVRARDVVEVQYPRAWAPDRAMRSSLDTIGRFATAGITRGTPLTLFSVSGSAWSSLPSTREAVPVRLQDIAVAELLRPGQHLRLVSIDPRSPAQAEVLVDDAVVLAVPAPERGTSSTTGRLVVFEVPAGKSNLVTSSAVSRYLT